MDSWLCAPAAESLVDTARETFFFAPKSRRQQRAVRRHL